MNRRQALKQIGAAGVVAVGATSIGSARTVDEIAPSELEYITAEIDGETRRFTPEEFDRHPDTRSLSAVPRDCFYECCECCNACCPGELCGCAGDCGSCPSC